MKIRQCPNANYKAIFDEKSGRTLRLALDPSRPIGKLEHPELLDISLGTKCFGECPYCYAGGRSDGIVYGGVIPKIYRWWTHMLPEERPFQVAIGGEGEPTLHPDFCDILGSFFELGIMPNYTTNGMHLTSDIIEATKKYAGGVALSSHPHLQRYWRPAIDIFTSQCIRTNLHIVIGEPGSVDYFWSLFDDYRDKVEYFVALPYQSVGRATPIDTRNEFSRFLASVKPGTSNIAFGALFYKDLLDNPQYTENLDISVYEPEVMSGYVTMCDQELLVRRSSYDPQPK